MFLSFRSAGVRSSHARRNISFRPERVGVPDFEQQLSLHRSVRHDARVTGFSAYRNSASSPSPCGRLPYSAWARAATSCCTPPDRNYLDRETCSGCSARTCLARCWTRRKRGQRLRRPHMRGELSSLLTSSHRRTLREGGRTACAVGDYGNLRTRELDARVGLRRGRTGANAIRRMPETARGSGLRKPVYARGNTSVVDVAP